MIPIFHPGCSRWNALRCRSCSVFVVSSWFVEELLKELSSLSFALPQTVPISPSLFLYRVVSLVLFHYLWHQILQNDTLRLKVLSTLLQAFYLYTWLSATLIPYFICLFIRIASTDHSPLPHHLPAHSGLSSFLSSIYSSTNLLPLPSYSSSSSSSTFHGAPIKKFPFKIE